jgi:methylated-DNA-protein-cysteine methyltransferase related protein
VIGCVSVLLGVQCVLTEIMTGNAAALRITSLIRKIPRGRVATYGQIAALADRPRNSRQVGSVLKSLPAGSRVPWHRVVNSQGHISDRNNSSSEGLQRCLLESEGVELNDTGRIDLKVFQWKPRKR